MCDVWCSCAGAGAVLQEKDMPLEQLLAMYGYQVPKGNSPAEGEGISSPQEVEPTGQAVLGDRTIEGEPPEEMGL